MLNRKPTTLAQHLSADSRRNIAECAIVRHRAAADRQDWHACNGESAASTMAFAQARLARQPFPIIAGDGIRHYGAIPAIDSLAIDREHHINEAINGKPLTVPDYVDRVLSDESAGWRETVCSYLCAVDDEDRGYDWRNFNLTGDLSGEIDLVAFFPADSADVYWCRDVYVVVDGLLYTLDGTLGDSGLFDDRIGWYVCDLSGDYLSECHGVDRYATGYSSDPTRELVADLIGEPVWHHGLNCFLGRLKAWPCPVRLHPYAPCYSG